MLCMKKQDKRILCFGGGNMKKSDLKLAISITNEIEKIGGTVYFVGGYVRDKFLNLPIKDIDIEIHNVAPYIIEDILKKFGELQTIGKSFGVYNIKGYDLDIALPRKEIAAGTGHKDFNIQVDPYLSLIDSAKRRDFTINALMENAFTGEIKDFFGGLDDLKSGIIRHVDNETFKEDPLRVLRACQFAARFDFKIAPETIELCKIMDLSTLPKERIAGELTKVLLKADKPSIFFDNMYDCEQTEWFKEVYALKGIEQDDEYHPEGNVYNHTMSVIDEASFLFPTGIDNPGRHLPFMLSALCHDFGKVNTTKMNDKGRICALDHEITGIPIANGFLNRIYNNKHYIKYVDNMIENHMKAHSCFNNNAKVKTTNLLFDKLLYPTDFIHLVYADSVGHNIESLDNKQFNIFLCKAMEENSFLTDRYFDYKDRISEVHITANDLISMGLKPSPLFSKVLSKTWDLHLKGVNCTNKAGILKQVAAMLHGEDKKLLLDAIKMSKGS